MNKVILSLFWCLPLLAIPDTVTHYDDSGTGQTNYPVILRRTFVKGEFPLGKYPQAQIGGMGQTTQVNVLSSWPDNSIKQALIAYVVPSIAASGSTTVTFIQQNVSNSGTCLSQASMQGFNGGTWDASFVLTGMSAGNLGTIGAQAMLSALGAPTTNFMALGPRYWMCGSVMTQLILEDRSAARSFDTGTDSHKSMHPFFILTFWPGLSLGVQVTYVMENGAWYDYTQDQTYGFTLANDGGTVFTPSWTQPHVFGHSSRWYKVFWEGVAPHGWLSEDSQGIHTDLNLAYMIASGDVPNYDSSIVISNTGITTEVTQYNTDAVGEDPQFCFTSPSNCGEYAKSLDGGGSRPEIGWMPRWFLLYFYSHDSRLLQLFYGNGRAALNWPMHIRGSDNTKPYDRANTTTEMGRPLSLVGYPMSLIPPCIGSCTTLFNFGGSAAEHFPNMTYAMWLMTGSYVWYEEMEFLPVYETANAGCTDPTLNFCRHNDWGWIRENGPTRLFSWFLEHRGLLVWMLADNNVEQTYWTQQLYKEAAIWEGRFAIQGNMSVSSAFGLTPPPGGPPSCAGYNANTNLSEWLLGYCTVSTFNATQPTVVPGAVGDPIGIPYDGSHNQFDFDLYTHWTASGITPGNPTIINIPGHNFSNGDRAYFSHPVGAWACCWAIYTATVIDANNISIPLNSTGFAPPAAGSVWVTAMKYWMNTNYEYGYQTSYRLFVLGDLNQRFNNLFNRVWSYDVGWRIDLIQTPGNNPYNVVNFFFPTITQACQNANPINIGCQWIQNWTPWTPGCESNMNGVGCVYRYPFSTLAFGTVTSAQNWFNDSCGGIGYAQQAKPGLAYGASLTSPVGGNSGLAAWNWLTSHCAASGFTEDPSWAVIPLVAPPTGIGSATISKSATIKNSGNFQ